MNIQRLEMMKQMMGRVVAGSWFPVESLPDNDRFRAEVKKLKIISVNLYSWSNHKIGNQNSLCGFTACAVGHACFDEEFRKLGWKWSGSQPNFNNKLGWVAVEKFFEIDSYTAELLFKAQHYNNRAKYNHINSKVREAQMVLDRIELLIQFNDQQKFQQHVGGM